MTTYFVSYGLIPTRAEAEAFARTLGQGLWITCPWDGLVSSIVKDGVHFTPLSEEGIQSRIRNLEDCVVLAADMVAATVQEPIPTRARILREAERLTCGDRNAQYGSPEKNFREIAAGWSLILGHEVSPSEVALCMAWLKILRATTASGVDSETDGAAYMAIAAELRDA